MWYNKIILKREVPIMPRKATSLTLNEGDY